MEIKDGAYELWTLHSVLAINYSAMPIGKMKEGGGGMNIL